MDDLKRRRDIVKVDNRSTKEGNKIHVMPTIKSSLMEGGDCPGLSPSPMRIGLNWLQPWKKIRRGERSHVDDEPQRKGKGLCRK